MREREEKKKGRSPCEVCFGAPWLVMRDGKRRCVFCFANWAARERPEGHPVVIDEEDSRPAA